MNDAFVTFERDLGADRSVARLRLAGAVIVGASSILLAVGGGGSWRWIWVVLGGLASLGWLAAYLKGRSPPAGDQLELGVNGLRMRYRDNETHVAWSQMETVIADEDRLHVHVALEDGELLIPLVWRGIGLHELAECIEAARLAAKSENGDAPRLATP